MSHSSLLHLLHLVSPALPVGAYAYSQGQEFAVECGHIKNVDEAGDWIGGIMQHSVARLDLPVLCRLYAAWQQQDIGAVKQWNQFLRASRETAEFDLEDQQMGRALIRLLASLDVEAAAQWPRSEGCCYATAFALAACHWALPVEQLLEGFCWSWLENQVAAATKLVPLGQTEAQQLLMSLMPAVQSSCALAQDLGDDDIGSGLPALALMSAQHETQYSRLFRS